MPWTEADEVAASVRRDLSTITSWVDAHRAVTAEMGPPSEVGHQLHDNLTEALLGRATAAGVVS